MKSWYGLCSIEEPLKLIRVILSALYFYECVCNEVWVGRLVGCQNPSFAVVVLKVLWCKLNCCLRMSILGFSLVVRIAVCMFYSPICGMMIKKKKGWWLNLGVDSCCFSGCKNLFFWKKRNRRIWKREEIEWEVNVNEWFLFFFFLVSGASECFVSVSILKQKKNRSNTTFNYITRHIFQQQWDFFKRNL